jgi:hypothetical protein
MARYHVEREGRYWHVRDERGQTIRAGFSTKSVAQAVADQLNREDEGVRRNPIMLGPGGKMLVPESEGAVIMSVIRDIEQVLAHASMKEGPRHVLDRALDKLKALGYQVSHGYHRNPPRPQFEAGGAVRKLSDDVHELRYTHIDDGDNYKHEFGGEVEMWAVLAGSDRRILLIHKRGEPLWEDFG